MRIAREVALYNQGGIQNGIDGAEDRASKVATSFITRVSESEGIKVHNADDTTDYIQINSNGIDLVNDNVSIANFGESARVGKEASSRFMINADSLEAYDDTNEKYFEVGPNGMTYGAHTVADTDYADGKASAAQSAAEATAAADATAKANAAQANAEKVATNFITTDSTGIKVHNTNDSTNYTHIGSSGMDVYQGDANNPVASFGATKAQVGKSSTGHTVIQSSGMQIYGSTGTVELANIGYGGGKAESGSTANAPYYSFAEREGTVGNYSLSEGFHPEASGFASHAEGRYTVASGGCAHAEGGDIEYTNVYIQTTASGDRSHAEGTGTTASGDSAHSEGVMTEASGDYSHAEGYQTVASGTWSHASGNGTIASSRVQTVVGEYNVQDGTDPDTRSNYSFIAGNGGSNSSRSNALAVSWGGDLRIKGDLYSNCSADSTGGTLLKVLKVTRSSVSSLPASVVNAAITANMEVLHCVLSNPSAQTGDWTVTTSTAIVQITGSISGTTDITLYLAEPSV